jgi:hypothetical protein
VRMASAQNVVFITVLPCGGPVRGEHSALPRTREHGTRQVFAQPAPNVVIPAERSVAK